MANNYGRSQGAWDKKGSKEEALKVLLSFEYLDIAQGQTLKQWSENGELLLKLAEIGASLNKLTYRQAITGNIIEEYDVNDKEKFSADNMPKVSKWKYPKTLQDKSVRWCKIRLGSTRRVIGHMKNNIFHVVFLDKDHEFYPTEPKDT